MKALSNLKSAFGIITLAVILPVSLPHSAMAADTQASGQQNQVFEINITDLSILSQSPKQTENNSLSINAVAQNDPLVIALKEYLEKHNSPMAEYAADIIQQPQWQRALAISYVESHMGRYCHSNNCSGIGGAPGMKTWRKYATKLDWFKDMCQLLEKPIYKEKYTTFQKMRGVYVQPGSANWVNGATKKYNDLMAITSEAETDRKETASLLTFAENN